MSENSELNTKQPFAGWRMLVIAALAIFFTGPAQTYGISVFVQPMSEALDISQSLFSTLYSLGTLVSAIVLMLVGRVLDRIGSRKVMAAAALAMGAALFLLSMVNAVVPLFLGFALLRSSGQGVLSLGARTLVPMWFHSRAGRAFSVVTLAAMGSQAAIPIFSNFLVESFGWREAFRINAFIIWLVIFPIIWFLVRDRPEDLGQYPDGIKPEVVEGQDPPSSTGLSLKEASRTFTFWALLGASLVPSLVVTGLAFNQVTILTERGLPNSLAASSFAFEAAVALPVAALAGWMSDRFPVSRVLVLGQVLMLAAMGVLLIADNTLTVMLYAALRGASGGMWMVGADTAWPSYFGRKHLGSIRSVGVAVGVAGAAIGPIPFGISFDLLGGYNAAILALAPLPLLAGLAVSRSRPMVPSNQSTDS